MHTCRYCRYHRERERGRERLGVRSRRRRRKKKKMGSYVLFFVMGMGVLFPWNAIITAIDYFESLYEVN